MRQRPSRLLPLPARRRAGTCTQRKGRPGGRAAREVFVKHAALRPVTLANCDHEKVQHSFLAILPRIERHGRVYFRHVRCASTKEECLAEMTALSWRWW